jgi:hypothetical protein
MINRLHSNIAESGGIAVFPTTLRAQHRRDGGQSVRSISFDVFDVDIYLYGWKHDVGDCE